MKRQLAATLALLCLGTGCGPERDDALESLAGPTWVDCEDVPEDAVSPDQARGLGRTIQLHHVAKVLAQVDAQPELVCARLSLDSRLGTRGRGRRVEEEVGVAGFVAVRSSEPQELLYALFERGAPAGRVLGLAARMRRDGLVEWLLDQGIDPESGDALIEAAAVGGITTVRRLLAAGVDPDQRASYDSPLAPGNPTPLFFAIQARRADIAELLLDDGAWANIWTSYPDEQGEGVSLLQAAVRNGLWSLSARLVDEGADPNSLAPGERARLRRAARGFGMDQVVAALED